MVDIKDMIYRIRWTLLVQYIEQQTLKVALYRLEQQNVQNKMVDTKGSMNRLKWQNIQNRMVYTKGNMQRLKNKIYRIKW